jgi:hypothetical protein
MASRIRLIFLLILVMIIICAINAIDSKSTEQTPRIVPGAYIVEFSPALTRLQASNHV